MFEGCNRLMSLAPVSASQQRIHRDLVAVSPANLTTHAFLSKCGLRRLEIATASRFPSGVWEAANGWQRTEGVVASRWEQYRPGAAANHRRVERHGIGGSP